MPEISIRRLVGEEIITHYAPLHQYALSSSPPIDLTRYENNPDVYEECAVTALFEGEKCVATTLGIPMTQNVRGKIFPMLGVAGVTSDPTTRRKGYVRQVMQATHRSYYEEGYPVAMLYPFLESFYERMGYVTFPNTQRIKFKTESLVPLVKQEFPGTVEYIHANEGWDTLGEFRRQHQGRTHGMGMFNEATSNMIRKGTQSWVAIARDESGTIIGTMTYKITKFFGVFEVSSFFTVNSLGRYLLLNWIARHAGQTTEVDIKLAPDERPKSWFADMKPLPDPDIWIMPLCRVLDIRKLGGMTVGEGSLCIDITDEYCQWNSGIYTLHSNNGILEVEAGGEPECALSIHAVSALIYGTHDPHDFQWRGWGTPSAETLEKMSALFPMMSPYLFNMF